MFKKHSILSGFILGTLVILIIWFFSSDMKEMMVHFLSSVLTLGFIASTVFLVQRKYKVNKD